MISGSLVRTTHLTGMVTDLGIDLSKAATSLPDIDIDLRRRIYLRLFIIGSFLGGGIGAWRCYSFMQPQHGDRAIKCDLPGAAFMEFEQRMFLGQHQ